MSKLKDYPECIKERYGCKVGWRWYATEDEAKTAGKAARFNAQVLAHQGYDFGYQCPGSVHPATLDGKEVFRVCVP